MEGIVAKSTGSWYEVWLENGTSIQCRLPGKFRLQKSTLTNPVAVGDVVRVQAEIVEEALIVEILPRRNYLLRKATKSSSQFQIVASNIDQAVIIATHSEPRTSTGFIDRFLVTCALYEIEPIILFNKTDLIGDWDGFREITSVYREAGYTVLESSLVGNIVSQEIRDIFNNKITLLFGHSGVGKSTLLNLLIPNAAQSVGNISDQHKKGKHTTTFAQMFKDVKGNVIIDTPGVKEFGIEELEPWRLGHCFKEFKKHILQCKYNTCIHLNEPDCQIITEFAEGRIAEFRYENYLNILNDLT